MLKKLKQTIKHTSVIALGKLSSKLVGFILLPIYTREITVADYGVLGLLEVVELLGVQLLAIGLHQALLRWYSLAGGEIDKKRIAFTSFVFITGIALVSIVLAQNFRVPLSETLFNDAAYSHLFLYVFLTIGFANLAKISQTILRVEEKTVLYAVSVFLQFLVSLVLNIYFVAIQKRGVEGVILARTISTGLLFLVLLPYQMRRMHLSFNFSLLREMMAFSYPFILTAIGATVLNLGDRYLLKDLSSLKEVGLYSLGYKFSNILKIILVDAFALGLPIIGWKMVREDNQPKRFFSKTLTYSVFALLVCGLILSVYARGIIHLFALNRDYWSAHQVVPLLVLAVVFYGMQQNFYFILQIPKKTQSISIIITTAAVLNIGLNFIAIPLYGMMGSAIVRVISQIFAMFFAYYRVRKYYPIQFEVRKILLLFMVATGLYFGTFLFDAYSFSIRIILKGLLILSFPAVLYLFKFYEPVEIETIRRYLRKMLPRSRETK